MRSFYPSLRVSNRGQALVEFAVCLVVLSIFVFGLIQFGHMVSIWSRLASVAREGGRSHVALNYGPADYPTDSFTIMEDMFVPVRLQRMAVCVSAPSGVKVMGPLPMKWW